MSDAASGAMASVSACGLGPGAPFSRHVVTRAAPASPRRAAPYTSLRRSSDIGMVRRIGIRRRVDGNAEINSLQDSLNKAQNNIEKAKVVTSVADNRAKRRL